jgi:NhaP-type Na+/H+ or K+/H+ antiporter
MFLRYLNKKSLTVGGCVLGVIVGLITAYLAKKALHDSILCINATFISGFVAFFFAESVLSHMGFAISGIMTLIALGLVMS